MRERQKARILQTVEEIFGTGSHVCSVVNEQNLLYDPTRWSGPGKKREARLCEEAERFLRRAAREKRTEEKRAVNAAQIERLLQKPADKREHHKELPTCTARNCWCGICHCTRCQRAREQALEPAANKDAAP